MEQAIQTIKNEMNKHIPLPEVVMAMKKISLDKREDGGMLSGKTYKTKRELF